MNFTEARSEAKRLKQAYLVYGKAEEVLTKALDAEQTIRNLNDEISKANKELTLLASQIALEAAQHKSQMEQYQAEQEQVLASNKKSTVEMQEKYEKLGGELALSYKAKVEANDKAMDLRENLLSKVETKYNNVVEALAGVRADRAALLEKLGG